MAESWIRKERVLSVVRFFISAALILLLLGRIEVKEAAEDLAAMNPKYLLAALAVIALHRISTVYKWNLLLRAKGFSLSLVTLAWIWLINNFAGLFLPTTVGEDVARTLSLNRVVSNPAEAVSSVVVDRAIGLMTLLIVASASALLTSDEILQDSLTTSILALTLTVLVGLAALRVPAMTSTLKYILDVLPGRKTSPQFSNFLRSIKNYADHRQTIIVVVIISFFVQCFRILTVYFASLALGIEAHLYTYFLFVPLIIIVTMLPISIGGIGVREGAYIYFFSFVGVPAHSAFVLSLLSYAMTLFAAIPGGILYAVVGLPKNDFSSTAR